MIRILQIALVALALLALASLDSPGPRAPDDVGVCVKAYRSRSGEYELWVDPFFREQGARARWTMIRGGEELYMLHADHALEDAAVSDDGIVIGYGYIGGGGSVRPEFRVSILSENGELLSRDSCPRTPGHGLKPEGVDVFVHDDSGRGVVRMALEDVFNEGEVWWTYELATGEVLDRSRIKDGLPNAKRLRFLDQALPVPETPLTLLAWSTSSPSPETNGVAWGTAFILLDAKRRPVWSLERPRDHEVDEDQLVSVHFSERMRREGSVRSTGPGARFQLAFVADSALATFEVTSDEEAPSGWSVVEVDREPHVFLTAEESCAKVERTPAVEGETDAPWIRDVLAFEPHDGGLRFVRREGQRDRRTLVRVDLAGALIDEVPIRLPVSDALDDWVPTETRDWLWFAWPVGPSGCSAVWRLNGETGVFSRIEEYCGGPINAAVATQDDGFAVAWNDTEDSGGIAVSAFDSNGRRVGGSSPPSGGTDGSSLDTVAPYCNDLVRMRDGRLVGNGFDELYVFEPPDQLARVLPHSEFCEEELSVLLCALPDGRVLAESYGSLFFIPLDGGPAATYWFTDPLSLASGSWDWGLRAAPDGTLWSTNGRCFLRIDSTARVVERVGGPRSPSSEADPREE